MWDQDRLANCTVIATGSNTMDVQTSSERLPGRRGTTRDTLDKTMFSMKFSEFVAVMDADAKDLLGSRGLARAHMKHMIFENKLDVELERLQPFVPLLNRRLRTYLLTGEMPSVVNEYLGCGVMGDDVYRTHLDAILEDIQLLSRNPDTFRQLARSITATVGCTSSWRSFQKDTDIGSQMTVSSYVDTLVNMFVLSVFYQYGTKSKRGLLRKDKKVCFHDPFYFHVLNGWIGGGLPSFDIATRYIDNDMNQGVLVENVVANHLIWLAFDLSPKKQFFEYFDLLFHWKCGKKGVDFVYKGVDEVPIDVKFQNRITARDLDGIVNFKRRTRSGSSILLTKDKLSLEREFVAVPVSLFFLLV